MPHWVRTYPALLPLPRGCVAVVGNFDGVHPGHQYLLNTAQAQARDLGLPLVALTFWPHPRQVVNPQAPLKLLQTLPQRCATLHAEGAQGVAVVPFNGARAAQSAEAFGTEILKNWLHVQAVVVGENFRFGHKAQGTPALLAAMGIPCTAVPLLHDEGGPHSSTRLRGLR